MQHISNLQIKRSITFLSDVKDFFQSGVCRVYRLIVPVTIDIFAVIPQVTLEDLQCLPEVSDRNN